MRRLREHPSAADAVPLPQGGKATIREYRFSRHNAFPKGEGKEEAASPPKKEANPASLRSAAPSKGRGSRGHSLLPMEGGAPKGRRLDEGSGMNWNIDSIGLFNIARYTASMPLLPSALPPKGEARRHVANDFLNIIALLFWGVSSRSMPYRFSAVCAAPFPWSLRSLLDPSLQIPSHHTNGDTLCQNSLSGGRSLRSWSR